MRTGERSLYPRLRCRLSPTAVGRSPTADAAGRGSGTVPHRYLAKRRPQTKRMPASRLAANSIALLLRTPGRTVRKRGQFSPIPHGKRPRLRTPGRAVRIYGQFGPIPHRKRPRLRTPGRTVRKGGHSRCGIGPQDAIRRARSFEHACRQRHSHSTPRFSTATSARTAPKSMALTKLLLLPRHPRNVESTRNPIARKQMTKEGRVHYVIV